MLPGLRSERVPCPAPGRAGEVARASLDDCRVERMETLCAPDTLIADLPRTPAAERIVRETRGRIHGILTRAEDVFLVIVGPCSIHDQRAAMTYARWLRERQLSISPAMLLIMRIYVAKPRTHTGWKGLVNDPWLDGSCRVNDGIRLAREIMRDVNDLGVPVATEFVDPITPQYLADLVSWGSIGARTVESQTHRELASGLSCPVGFKNGTSGDITVAINAVATAAGRHQFVGVTKEGKAAIISTTGNADCHVVLRGGVTPNYDELSIRTTAAQLRERDLRDTLIVDCSHANCAGDYRAQVDAAAQVCRQLEAGDRHIKGLMLESNLVEGRQQVAPGEPLVFGKSITDACLGLPDTERLLSTIERSVGSTRGHRCA
jgi:3-deoxy-7-phosphoheptulonate synthase